MQFSPLFACTLEEAVKSLDRTRVNCAVIDIRIPRGANDTNSLADTHGNNVLEKLLIESGIPAVVYSAYSAEVSDIVRSSNITIHSKTGGGAEKILRLLASQKPLMSAMESTRKKMAIESARIFNGSIWKRWQNTWKSVDDKEMIASMITRQIASHVADQLGLPPASHHPDEFYIIPPLFSERLDTGDLLRREGIVYAVVTPRCNLANGITPNYLTLAQCNLMENEWNELKEKFFSGKKGEISAATRLRNYAIQNHSLSTHFIPPCDDDGPWLVDFRETIAVPSNESNSLIAGRFASISSQFVPNLVQRYAAYLGRIGQPDIDCDVLRKQVCQS